MNSLSVIIPNYNKAKYLDQCIQSVLNQTYQPDEIIVVDDVSTDNSCEILTAWSGKDPRIKLIFLPQNGGVSHARNAGLMHATSEYVTFLDADDFYTNQEKLQNEMDLIRENGEDSIAYSKIFYVNEMGEPCSWNDFPKRLYLTGKLQTKYLTGNFEFATIARDYCVKKSILEEVGGYNENRSLYEDLELLIKLSEKYIFLCTYQFGTAYRQIAGGLSSKTKEECERERKKIYDECTKNFSPMKKMKIVVLYKLVFCKEKLQGSIAGMKKLIKRVIRK